MSSKKTKPADPYSDYFRHLKRRNFDRKTIENRRSMLKVFSGWLQEAGIAQPAHVSHADLEHFQVWLSTDYQPYGKSVGVRTIASYLTALRSFYGYLHKERKILTDPAKNLRSPKKPKRIHRDILSVEELNRLLTAPDCSSAEGLRDATALRLLSLSGLRASELCDLNIGEVNLQDRELIIRQGKGKKDRLGFCDQQTRQVIARYLVQSRPVLTGSRQHALIVSNKGKRMVPADLRQIIRAHATKAKIRKHLTCHSLRRTFCTLLLQAGCNLKVIAELAGHENLSTTAGYTKLDISELSAVYRQAHPKGNS